MVALFFQHCRVTCRELLKEEQGGFWLKCDWERETCGWLGRKLQKSGNSVLDFPVKIFVVFPLSFHV
jgi:hypothetical protein